MKVPQNTTTPSTWLGVRLWWAYYWRVFAASLLPVLVVMVAFLHIGRAMELPGGATLVNSLYAGLFIAGVISLLVIYRLMTKGFSDLRLVIANAADMRPLEPGMALALKTWWALTWRTGLLCLSAAIGVAGYLALNKAITDASWMEMKILQFFLNFIAFSASSAVIMILTLKNGFGHLRMTVTDRFANEQKEKPDGL